jgi:methylenetetrahydrofolate reductase (NADPH)
VEKAFQDGKPAHDAVVEALACARYEVIPLRGIEDRVTAGIPRDVKLTVTVSPTRGIEPTLETSERLAQSGYEVVPHVSGRLVRSLAHLDEILERLEAARIREMFVVAGDAEHPAGPFDGAHALLVAMTEHPRRPKVVGITGYPESHPFISDDETVAAMFAKAAHADYIVSQITFDADVIGSWIVRVRRRGTQLPIYIGLPGDVDRGKLLRISIRVGVGESARFLRRHGNWLTRLFAPRGYRPDEMLVKLAPYLADPASNVAGLHLYTFNEVEQTERWRRAAMERFAYG